MLYAGIEVIYFLAKFCTKLSFFLLILGHLHSSSGLNTNPSCPSFSVLKSFPESTAVGVLVTLACTDADTAPDGTITYGIKSGNDLGLFGIDSTTGAISLISTIDYDDFITPHTHTLAIEVKDGGTPSLTAAADVIVTLQVTGVNDKDPEFIALPYTTTLAENLNFNDFVYGPAPVDLDIIDDISTLQPYTCSIVSAPPDSDYFTIDPDSCEVRYVNGFDREVQASHTITLELADIAVDAGHSPSRTVQTTLTITLTDVNDNSPSCTASSYAAEVQEDATVGGAAIITVTCTDDDSGVFGTVSYAIVSGNDDGYFSVTTTGGNGEIKLANTFDYDDFVLPARSYQLTVRASDDGTPSLSTDVSLKIILKGINDLNPQFMSTPYTTTLPENLNVDGFVYDASWLDLDVLNEAFELQLVVCSIVGGDTSMFHCETTIALSCRCTLMQKMDYETATSHWITLQIDDVGFTTVLTAKENLTITVSDVNDEAPVCTPSYYFKTIQEDATINTVLVDLTGVCTDSETATAALTYSITSGSTTKYQMTGAILELKATIDVETEVSVWSVEITVTDIGAQIYTTPTVVYVTINVDGVDDNVPVWHVDNSGVYIGSVPENSAVGTLINTITATDSDLVVPSDAQITYGIDTVTTLFGIVPSTGEIYVASTSIDRETTATHTLTISAYSSTLSASKITGTITITVTDDNDITPAFTQDAYTITVAEDHAVAAISFVPAIAATDTDTGVNSQITYVLTGSAHTVTGCEMSIDSTSGVISLTNNLDYETKTSCVLTIEARDGGTPSLTGTASAIITVTQVNEFTPGFTGTPYSTDHPENTAIGTSLFTVVATDADTGDDGRIEYSLTSHTTVFSVESSTGVIRLKSALDSETLNTYSVNVEAIDQSSGTKLTGAATLTVNVLDVNEFTPQCTNVVFKQLTPPIAITDLIHTLDCVDNDIGVNGQITYSFLSGNTNSDFAVATNGAITVANLLSQVTYDLEIQASDNAVPPLSSVAYVYISVASDPVFTNLPLPMDINEATTIGTLIYTVIGSSATASKTFSITNGNGDNKFSMNAYTGAIYLLNLVDREITPSYVLTIRISDAISGTSADSTLTLTVTDSNDNTPTFPNDFYNIPIVENVTPTTEIIDIAASDADDGVNKNLVYTIASGDPGGVFSVNLVGKLILDTALDVETTSSYTLIVTAKDGGTPSLTGTTTCYVTISDVDEFPTEFLSAAAGSIYTKSLSEDTAIGSKVFNVSARDLDVTADISYSITGGNDGSFLIDQNTGDIYLSKLLDRETVASYSLTIQADNGLGDTPTATLNIQVTDVNDNQPQFTPSTGSNNVDENEAIGAMITTIVCNDVDDGLNSNLIYTIVGGNTGTAFRLDGTTIEVNSALDYETVSQYILVVEAKDQGVPVRSASMSLIINVNPIYPLPKHIAATDTINIIESTILGTLVYDDDATVLGALEGTSALPGDLEYIIQTGNGDGKFFIDEHSGEIKVVGTLDRDTTASYSLLIKAVNRNDPTKTDFLLLTVTLGDINDITPAFGSSVYTFSVDEDAALSAVVNTVAASDGDDGVNSVITYSITAGENMVHFDIAAATGVISVNSALDAAIQSTYFLTVSVVDGGTPPLTGTCQVQITVNDLNDKTPTFSAPSYNLSLSELAAISSTIFQFRADDADTGPNSILTYNIASGNGDLRYTLDPITGDLLIAGILDRESTDSYSLLIEATDSGIPINTGNTNLYISIIDANDNDPVVTGGVGSFTIPRTSGTGTSITTITATDADINENGAIEFYIVSGDPDSLFYIDSNTGVIATSNILTTASDTNDLIVHVVDKGSTRNTVIVTVQVTVDPPIAATPSDYNDTVAEDAILNTGIVTVAPDPVHVPGATIHFTILNGDSNNDLSINLLNGLISTAKLLDYSVKSDYYITIHVEDQGDPTKTYNKAVHITVIDVNNNNPVFTIPTQTISVVENSPVGLSIATAIATDKDAGAFGTITYEIDPTDAIAIILVSVDNNGEIQLISSPDYETLTVFSFFVYAKDGGTPTLSGTATINVNIINVNDVDPSAAINTPSGYFSFECPTNANTNDVITILTPADFGIVPIATDTVQYITMNDRGVFNFNSTSGEFFVRDSQYLYVQTRYIMWVVLRVQSISGDANGTSAMIRVDSLTPNYHLVILKHSVTGDVLEAQRNSLRASLQAIFPAYRVGIWRINSISAARRRRLLAAESESIIYVCDTAADTIDGIANEKTCLSQSDIQQVLSDADGTPATVLTTAAFSLYPVTSVESYVDPSTSSSQNWAQTTVGIAVIATIVSTVVLLVVILFLYFLCTRNGHYSFKEEKDQDFPTNNNENNNEKLPYTYASKPKKTQPFIPRASTPVFSGIGQSPSRISNGSDVSQYTGTKPKKDRHNLVSSIMSGNTPQNEVPPALFHDGKYMKENPNADVSREGTITPRQILIESKRPISVKSHSSY